MSHDLNVNDKIRAKLARVIDESGEQLGIMEVTRALELAEQRGADLVEVSPESDPPVCRMMDFGKYKYKQKKKLHQGHKKVRIAQIKEVRVRPKTDTHDLGVKMRKARQFLEAGDRVIINMLYRGREMPMRKFGPKMLMDIAETLSDLAKVEKEPVAQGRRISIVLSPRQQ